MPKPLRVLVACEFSGRVRDAFLREGCDAWSCDLLLTNSDPSRHIQDNVLNVLDNGWDLMIAHPPCTHLAVSGAAHFRYKQDLQEEALRFVLALLNAPIPQIALENPVGVISSRIGPPTQIVHPYWFGDPDRKQTCWWLKALPLLVPTELVTPHLTNNGRRSLFQNQPNKVPVVVRSRVMTSADMLGYYRSVTGLGTAAAIASQWAHAKDHCWRSSTGCRLPSNYEIKPRASV